MKKSSLLLCMAAGVFASLALATPSQAGSTTVTTSLVWSISGPNNPTATDLTIDYSAVDPISNLKISSDTFVGGVTITEPTPDILELSFSAQASGSILFTFQTNENGADVGGTFGPMSGVTNGPVKHQNVVLNISATPEPASLALLGIGMTGFLAFRRFFKKTSVA
jgi:hypothetical protein